MSEFNKSYRIKANVGGQENIFIETDLTQDYETLDILSIKIKSVDTYRLHNSNYGVVVGRVLANNGFGIPNAKLSIFIKSDTNDGEMVRELYPFSTSYSKDNNDVRYNLLPDEPVNDCHQVVGTFPNKRYMLDNDVVLEVFDKYYKYTTRTNNAGDYIIMGVPVGNHTLHMDLDLSDCGILSQKPRDFIYKGYTVEQFENPTQFKKGTNYSELSQIFTQDRIINVIPFWGNASIGESIGITRADIDVAFKFEPTCVFIGSVVSDNSSNGITKKCKATENMGNMEEMTTGEGTIEMIRKTPSGDIESFAVRGNQLINGNGVWCYQIPMNLDYMMTDEYGNMVPTNDPEKGIPTRTSVRFRISMQDNEENLDNFFRCKVLVPHNPQFREDGFHEPYDYEFGSFTSDESFRDLFWDNVYTVKSYIPRFQKKKAIGWKDKEFTGIKSCNFHGSNNPIPYNNMRIKLPLMFTIMCAIIKCLIFITGIFNLLISIVGNILADIGNTWIFGYPLKGLFNWASNLKLNVLSEGLCPDLENWYFAPITLSEISNVSATHELQEKKYNLLQQTINFLTGEEVFSEPQSIDYQNKDGEEDVVCLTTKTDYIIACIEMNLAMEYRVINFDFYNDWINGLIYVPRFMRYVKPKKNILGFINVKAKTKGCMDDTSVFSKSRYYAQQCALKYNATHIDGNLVYTSVLKDKKSNKKYSKANKYHKGHGFVIRDIFEKRGGICHEHTTSRKQHVYYMKPCEWLGDTKANLYATDIVLLGSLKACDENGLPQAFKYLSSTSYVMPTNLALTNMETNGPLYVNNNNTVCAGRSTQNISNINNDRGVQMTSNNLSITDELDMYKKTGDPRYDIKFKGEELSDVIPVTEAAGISWNYTGPGQGEVNMNNLYYPGGHFLGMSCVNSQTNIKSCVNLSRICEIGVTMSQRKEDVYDIDGKNAKYVYTVPSGFISGNEINGEDFRTMFATMNQKRLQATKLNMDTGYDYYNLQFVKPVNFDGTFSTIASASEYNKKTDVPISSKEALMGYGIALGEGYDYDEEEANFTQIRTIEDTSIDYYRFRFGLDYEHLNKKSKVHNSRFLLSNGNIKYLPQYENSYYFYFGLKAGATAIDEFNKQFYSTCETSVIARRVPSISVNVENINMCEMTGDVSVVLDNVEMPLSYVKLIKNEEGKVITKDITDKYSQYYVFSGDEFSGMSFADYRIVVMDVNGVSLSTDFSIGTDLFNYVRTLHNFNVNDAMEHSGDTETIWRGGYISIDDVQLDPNYSDVCSSVTFIVKAIDDSGNTLGESGTTQFEMDGDLDDKEDKRIYVKSAYTKYNLYIQYDCDKSDGYGQSNDEDIKTLYLETFTLKDGSSVSLVLGRQDLNLYTKIEPNGISETVVPSGESATTIEIDNVSLNFGDSSSTKWWKNTNLDRDDNNRIGNWLKRLSIQKSTEEGTVFTNNIVAIDGNKVIWGVPQNYDGKYTSSGNTIFCSEDNITDYSGYSLDDDASYYGTDDQKHYSAIAVNDDLVSGDYFAILENNQVKVINNNLSPNKNTGYVFKSLPDNELFFYTYEGNGKYQFPENIVNGVFYSSFEYPVIEKPFFVDARFYIWAGYDIYMPENVDNIAEVRYTELAGRTEVTIQNGIKYKGNFGLTDNKGKVVSGFSFSNILSKDIESINMSNDIITLSGMNVTIFNEDEDGNVTTNVIPAFEKGKINGKTEVVYTKGVSGVTDMYYNVSEGYPSGSDYFPLLVNSFENSIEYSNYFGNVAKYKFYKGRGIEITIHGENGTGSGRGMICMNNNQQKTPFIILPDGNEKYVYLKRGKNKKPIYYILCEYIENGGVHTSPPGELCFMVIRYHNNRKFQLYFEYTMANGENGNSEVKKYSYYAKENVKSIKNNIEAILKYHSGWTSYIKPVYNYQINCSKPNWYEEINKDNMNYLNWLRDVNENSQMDSAYTYYYVDVYNSNLYKIYPLLREDNSVGDGINLETYYVNFPYSGGEKTIKLTYNIDKYVEVENVNINAEIDIMEAENIEEAKGKLYYILDDNDPQKASGTTISGSWYTINLKPSGETKGDSEGSDDVEFIVTYDIEIKVNKDNDDEYKTESIYFYISKKQNGVRLDIERLRNKNYYPYFTSKGETENGMFKDENYYLPKYEAWFNENESKFTDTEKEYLLGLTDSINEKTQILALEKDKEYNGYIYGVFEVASNNDDWLGFNEISASSSFRLNMNIYNRNIFTEQNGLHVDRYSINKIQVYCPLNLTGGIKVYEVEPYHNNGYSNTLIVYQPKSDRNIMFTESGDTTYVPWIYFGSGICVEFKTTFINDFTSENTTWEDDSSWNIGIYKVEANIPVDGNKTEYKHRIYLKSNETSKDKWFYNNEPDGYDRNTQKQKDVLNITYGDYELTRNIELKPNLSFMLACDSEEDDLYCQVVSQMVYNSSSATASYTVGKDWKTIVPLFDNRETITNVQFKIKNNDVDGLYYLTDNTDTNTNTNMIPIHEGDKDYSVKMWSNMANENKIEVGSLREEFGYLTKTFSSFTLKIIKAKKQDLKMEIKYSGATLNDADDNKDRLIISGGTKYDSGGTKYDIDIFKLSQETCSLNISKDTNVIQFEIGVDSDYDGGNKFNYGLEIYLHNELYKNIDFKGYEPINITASSLYNHENNGLIIKLICTKISTSEGGNGDNNEKDETAGK